MWRLNPKSSLHFRHWGNEWAVFDAGSGQTHEMDSVTAVALMYCETDWISLPVIAAGVAEDLNLATSVNLSEILRGTLAQFVSLELLEFRAQ